VTQELKTAVFLPSEYRLVGVPEHFVILSRHYGTLENWFDSQNRTSSLGHLPGRDRGHATVYGNLGGAASLGATWWETSSMAAGISIPIFAIGCVLLWTPWTNRLSVVLVATFIVSLLSLAYADSVFEALLAARWGIGFGVAAWMLAAVVGFQRSTDFPSLLGKLADKVPRILSRKAAAGDGDADAGPSDEADAADDPQPDGDEEASADGDSQPEPAEEKPGAAGDIYETDDTATDASDGDGRSEEAGDEADDGDSDADASDESDQTGSQS
jgi:hypothetical protein